MEIVEDRNFENRTQQNKDMNGLRQTVAKTTVKTFRAKTFSTVQVRHRKESREQS